MERQNLCKKVYRAPEVKQSPVGKLEGIFAANFSIPGCYDFDASGGYLGGRRSQFDEPCE